VGVRERQRAVQLYLGQVPSPGRPTVAWREDRAPYVQGRGALQRELVACLRTGRALRVPRARSRQKAWAHVTPEVLISERPAEAEDRAVPGHWEGDLIIGLQRSAIGTLVERTTRFTMLLHLPREEGYGIVPRIKNGPALAGYGAVTMKNVLASTMTTLPEQLRRSLDGAHLDLPSPAH